MSKHRRFILTIVAAIFALIPAARASAGIDILHHFTGGADGRHPGRLLPYDSDLVGVTAYFSDSTIFRVHPDGTGLQTLKTFPFGGDQQAGGLTASGSKLFGMVERLAPPNIGAGVFELEATGASYNRIHSFLTSGPAFATQLSGSGSTLFGAVTFGLSDPAGTVFRLNADGTGYQALHEFTLPIFSRVGWQVIAGAGSVFGTTTFSSAAAPGTLFRVGEDGTNFQVIHTFNNAAQEGYVPLDFVMEGSTIYGAVGSVVEATLGVASGSVYKMNSDGSGFEVLRSLQAGAGVGLLLIEGSTLYGTVHPGPPFGSPAIFRMNTDGTGYQVLHDFAADPNTLIGSISLMVLDGRLYGTTTHGGQYNLGTIFAVPIPEPSSVVLAAVSLAAGLIAVRSCKRRR